MDKYMDKYAALLSFILGLDQATLRTIRDAAEDRFKRIAQMVERNPFAPASATESVIEELLHALDDYIESE